jgi:tetratricopeptide (TPR) repeat protein
MRIVSIALAVTLGLAVIGCGDDAPAPKFPTKPVVAGGNPQGPAAPQIGMSDQPSSMRTGDLPDAGKAQMNASAQAAYAQAMQAFANGDLQTARTQFTAATQADSSAYQAFYSLGVVQERLRDPGAGGSYRQAYTIKSDYEPAIIAAAMYNAKKNQLSEAERLLNEKRSAMPKSAAVLAALAEIKSLQKDTGSAQRIAQDALKLNPDYRPAMVVIARDHYRNRRLDLALYALQAILDGFGEENPARDKTNAEAMLLRGLIYREQGQRQSAMEEFRRAVAQRPDLVEARVHYATYLLESGGAEEAQPVLEGAVRFDNDSLPSHLALGDCYRLLGRYPEAKKEFEWVVAHDSTLPQVHYDLGLLYLFAPSIPGMSAKQQVQEATRELKRFQEVRKKGEQDDSDELLNRAKLKEGEIDAAAQAAAAPPPPPPPPASGTPSAAPSAAPPTK